MSYSWYKTTFSTSRVLRTIKVCLGVRPEKYPVPRRIRATFGHCIQPYRAELPYQVHDSSIIEDFQGSDNTTETSTSKTSTLKALSASLKLQRNTMWTALSTSLPTMRMKIPPLRSSGPRYTFLHFHGFFWCLMKLMFLIGPCRKGRTEYIPRNHNR